MAKKTKRTTKKKATRQRSSADPSSVVREGEIRTARNTTRKRATKKKTTKKKATRRSADPQSVARQGEVDIAAARRRVRRANTIPAGLTTRRRELAEARRNRITAEQGGASQRHINSLKRLEERAATQVQRQRQAARNARRPTT